ncbi:MAG TPA: DNA glycosylase [Candidatus Nanoarchaeia archaeon]|nr:DNA glycosylase [Candidatus Nanoarchaeia archaeon]
MQIGVEDFSLQHTLESGQFFRYSKIGSWYFCQERDKKFKIRQEGKKLHFEGTSEEHIRKLFGLEQDYDNIIETLSKDKTLIPAIKKYKGLRVMQRDPWETLVSFQCSIFSNIKKIQLNMNRLAEEFGEKKGEHYTFPRPGKLDNLQKIKKCATGFRAKYIHKANSLVNDEFLAKLKKKNYEDAKLELMKLPGIGEKVADCICLFSLGKIEAFPVDVWIERMMTKMYFDGKKTRTKEIRQFASERWGQLAGYAQQFLYHWGRNQ